MSKATIANSCMMDDDKGCEKGSQIVERIGPVPMFHDCALCSVQRPLSREDVWHLIYPRE